MPYEYQLAVTVTLALVGGIIIGWIIMRSRIPAAIEKGRGEIIPELTTLKERVQDREQTLTDARQRLAEIERLIKELEGERNELDKQRAVSLAKESEKTVQMEKLSK